MRKRLLRFLCSRGVSAHVAEDAVQDVAERLLTREVPHTNIDDLMRWCMTVARNSAIDQHRRLRRSVPLETGDDVEDGRELVDLVEARLRLDRTLRALRNMSYDDLRCVIGSIDDEFEADGVASPALRARRHRLRRRLAELVGGFGLIGVLVRALRPQAGRVTLGLSSAAIASVALVTVVVGLAPHAGSATAHARLRIAPATVHLEPVADRAAVVRRSAAAPTASRGASAGSHSRARSAGQTGLHLRSPDKGGAVDFEGHDRGADDKGVACLRGLYYVDDVCVAPAVIGPHVPPAL